MKVTLELLSVVQEWRPQEDITKYWCTLRYCYPNGETSVSKKQCTEEEMKQWVRRLVATAPEPEAEPAPIPEDTRVSEIEPPAEPVVGDRVFGGDYTAEHRQQLRSRAKALPRRRSDEDGFEQG